MRQNEDIPFHHNRPAENIEPSTFGTRESINNRNSAYDFSLSPSHEDANQIYKLITTITIYHKYNLFMIFI